MFFVLETTICHASASVSYLRKSFAWVCHRTLEAIADCSRRLAEALSTHSQNGNSSIASQEGYLYNGTGRHLCASMAPSLFDLDWKRLTTPMLKYRLLADVACSLSLCPQPKDYIDLTPVELNALRKKVARDYQSIERGSIPASNSSTNNFGDDCSAKRLERAVSLLERQANKGIKAETVDRRGKKICP